MTHPLIWNFCMTFASCFLVTVATLKLHEARKILRELKAKLVPNVIHEPLGGPPPGFVHGGVLFVKDGKRMYGCVNPDGIMRCGVMLDVLAPGEQAEICLGLNVMQARGEVGATIQ